MSRIDDLKVTVQVNVQTTLNGEPAAPEYIRQSLHDIKTLRDALAQYNVSPDQVREAYAKARAEVLADSISNESGDRWSLIQYPFQLGYTMLGTSVKHRNMSLEDRLTQAAQLKQTHPRMMQYFKPFNTAAEAVDHWWNWAGLNVNILGDLQDVLQIMRSAAAQHIQTNA